MMFVSKVCAEFHDRSGAVLYTIRPHQLNTFIYDAPESIRQDPLFDMLVHENSIQIPATKEEKKQLENDPLAKLAETEAAGNKEETAAAAVTAEKPAGRKGSKA